MASGLQSLSLHSLTDCNTVSLESLSHQRRNLSNRSLKVSSVSSSSFKLFSLKKNKISVRARENGIYSASLQTEEDERLLKKRDDIPGPSASRDIHRGLEKRGLEKIDSQISLENGSQRISDRASKEISTPTKEGEGKGEREGEVVKEGEEEAFSSEALITGSVLAVLVMVGILVGVSDSHFNFKETLTNAIDYFERLIEGLGPSGYVVFVLGYAFLEMVAIPAIPLTMSAGLLFGGVLGTLLVTLAGTLAATGAFLISRYVARDRILSLLKGNKRFLAIDRAIGEDSFRVVTLLRLSPLLPFSLGNYVYGLTSVRLAPYILGSFIGMLPGTWAYVSAGSFGRSLLESEGGKVENTTQLITLAVGVLVTILAASYITKVAKAAVDDIDE